VFGVTVLAHADLAAGALVAPASRPFRSPETSPPKTNESPAETSSSDLASGATSSLNLNSEVLSLMASGLSNAEIARRSS
jgi:DNA-binding NarL/FixJ family response regulator